MRAGIYARISRDSEGEALGVERQEEDCRRLADRNGWQVVKVYPDNDVSASTRSSKARPQYARMLADVRAGEVDVLLAYSNSRLTRRPLELEDLISLHEQTGVVITTVVSGQDDLSTADGRMVARIKASVDAAEAERASERQRRAKEQRAARGLPQGSRWRVLGYNRNWEVIEAEAAVVREIFTRKAAGQSTTSIAKDLAGRGLKTVADKPWTAAALAHVLARSDYAGIRRYRGEEVGPTAYPAIIDEPLFRRANSNLVKMQPGHNARRWLLTGIAICGKCGGQMQGQRGGYSCPSHHGGCGRRIKVTWLEDPVISLVLHREASLEPAPRPASPKVDLGAIDDQIKAVREDHLAGLLTRADYLPMLAALRAKRKAAEAELAKAEIPSASGFLPSWNDWSDADLSIKRAMVGRHVDGVIVDPAPFRGSGFTPERLRIRWLDGTEQRVTRQTLDAIPLWSSEDGSFRVPVPVVLFRLQGMKFGPDTAPTMPSK